MWSSNLRSWFQSHLSLFRKHSSGVAAIEFAIILPVLLLFFIASVDFGMVLFSQMKLRTALNAGVAYAIGVSSTPAAVQTAIKTSSSWKNLTATVTESCQCSDNTVVSCTSTCTGGATPDTYLQIIGQTSVPLSGAYGFVANPYTLTETAKVMVK